MKGNIKAQIVINNCQSKEKDNNIQYYKYYLLNRYTKHNKQLIKLCTTHYLEGGKEEIE